MSLLTIAQEAEDWRCVSCVEDKLEPDAGQVAEARRRQANSNITRDLLPASTGSDGPPSHSIFNTLIIDDDPMDGSRALRKRKTSSADVEDHSPVLRKRQRRGSPSQSDRGVGAVDSVDGSMDADALSRTRPRRTRKADKEPCRVVQKELGKLVVSFRLDYIKTSKILNSRPRPLKTRRRRTPKPSLVQEETTNHFAPILPTYVAPFYSFHDREVDELKSKPYGGILSEADADTSRTVPTQADREKFELARRKAEEDWQQKVREAELVGDANHRASQKISGPPSKIKWINFGGYEIETWYAAPYPEEYSRNRILYICEFCLKYMNSDFVAWRHKLKCPAKHPPGDEIYRDQSISIFEVDGRKNPVYCQNLCLLAKLFLGSKTLYYDVEPFLFYVMTECDELGCHFVGYFSKEKRPSSSNNVSCILTLPIHQRKGYGNLLIDFSYLLTRAEKKTGSPEKPLSDMGLVSYRNYWRLVLSYQLRDQRSPVSIADLSERTGMTADDIVSGLEGLRALVRDPVTKTYALRLNFEYFDEYIQNWESKGYVKLNPDALIWTPYVMGRSNQSHYDRAQLHTVAPREDPDEEDEEEGEEENKTQVDEGGSPQKGWNGNRTDEGSPNVNGDGRSTSEGLPYAPAGPPSTAALSFDGTNKVNGDHNGAASDLVNPAAGIPPTRFEIYPPVQRPLLKRRPGRPWGSKTNYNRLSYASASRRRSSQYNAETPTAVGLASSRRGRSSLFTAEVTSGAESTTTNSHGDADDNAQQANGREVQAAEESAHAADVDSSAAENQVSDEQKPSGLEEQDPVVTETSAAKENGNARAASIGTGNSTPVRRTRKAAAEEERRAGKVQVVISSVKNGDDPTDSDVDAEGEADDEIDADGDVVVAL